MNRDNRHHRRASGFGAAERPGARDAGHGNAGMRDTGGHHAPQVAEREAVRGEHDVDLRSVDLDALVAGLGRAVIRRSFKEQGTDRRPSS